MARLEVQEKILTPDPDRRAFGNREPLMTRRRSDKLDAYDMKILKALADHGYIKNKDLAEMVGLSPSACHQRSVRLAEMKVFKGYSADIDYTRVSSSIHVMTLILLERQTSSEYAKMNRILKSTRQVVRALRISGDFDYLLETIAPDYDTYKQIIETVVNGDVAVKQYQSRIMQELVKSVNEASFIFASQEPLH